MDTLRVVNPNYRPYITATVLLDHLGEATAQADLPAMLAAKDAWVRRKASKVYLALTAPPKGPPPPAGQIVPERRFEILKARLGDSVGSNRELALREAALESDARLPELLIPCLSDKEVSNRQLACDALRHNPPRSEEALRLLHPFFQYTSNEPEEDYQVRLHALHCVHFPHGSLETQARLWELFDRPELGVRREMNVAFAFCPDPASLQQKLLERIDELSAIYCLGNFRDPRFRPQFLDVLPDRRVDFALAAVWSMLGIAQSEDVPALQEFRDYWKAEV